MRFFSFAVFVSMSFSVVQAQVNIFTLGNNGTFETVGSENDFTSSGALWTFGRTQYFSDYQLSCTPPASSLNNTPFYTNDFATYESNYDYSVSVGIMVPPTSTLNN